MEKYEQKAVEEGLSLFEKAITMLASGKSPSEVVLTGVPQNIVDRASRAMKPKLNKQKIGSKERITDYKPCTDEEFCDYVRMHDDEEIDRFLTAGEFLKQLVLR